MIVSIVFAVLFLLLAVVFLMGKGDMLIAGYNTASEEEKKNINIKRLRILMAVFSVITAAYTSVLPVLGNNAYAQMGATFVFLLAVIVFVVLANTWAKKK